MGDLRLLGWVVLKSNVSLSDELNEPFAKLCVIQKTYYWEKLVNTDDQKRSRFSTNYNGDRFKTNVDIPFHILEKESNIIFLLQCII